MEFLAPLLFLFLLLTLKTTRGWQGEAKTAFNMRLTLDPNVYRRVHNLIIPSKNGTAQIDHLLVSPFGLFIVETKNIKGWIFGSEKQANWTQSLYGKKFSFQNPIRQTFRQKRVLSEFLNLDEALIHTVIYFVGQCTFKTHLPPNVIRGGLGAHIKQHRNHILSTNEISRIMQQLDALRSDPSLTTRNHIKSLRARHNSYTVCPRCGSRLVERTVKNGSRAGSGFLGCSNYPRCKFTKNVS